MTKTTDEVVAINTEQLVQNILESIDREREREIIARRFGLFDRKETLEQIGELLGITRERVRQLEKAVVTKLRQTGADLPGITETETILLDTLATTGDSARVTKLSKILTADDTRTDQSRIAFIASLCPNLATIDEDDNFYQAIGALRTHNTASMKKKIEAIVGAIKKHKEPVTVKQLSTLAGVGDGQATESLASISKKLASLNGRWGLIKWPTVNPKNIRDKIYVILSEGKKHMHFSEIADAIKNSDFKRKDVTTQAIHNELIKDKRFVLIGRGIYALKEWGYSRGTVADIIVEVMEKAGEPLHRDEIVKRVLESRFVKETTILLNLQSKPQFKRVSKATYFLADAPKKAEKAPKATAKE